MNKKFRIVFSFLASALFFLTVFWIFQPFTRPVPEPFDLEGMKMFKKMEIMSYWVVVTGVPSLTVFLAWVLGRVSWIKKVPDVPPETFQD